MAQKHNNEYIEKPMTTYGPTQGPSRRYRRLRHPTFPAAEWTAKNPLLQRGEIGAESDTHKIKVGDGVTYWNDLPYTYDDAGANTDLSNLTATGKANISAQGTYDSGATYSTGTVGSALQGKLNLDGSNIMTGVLKMRASISFQCAIAPYWDGVGFYKLNDDNSVTLMASMESSTGLSPHATNTYDIGTSAHKWKDLYLAGKAYIATINNGGDIAVPTGSGTMALTSDIPTVNDATLTIQKNGTDVATFTANSATNTTANITVPTNTSDLNNDSGFITGITSSDVTTALGYTPYNSSNPNGYTSNVGTVTSVNNTSPDSAGNVTLSIPAAQVNSDWNANSGVAEILNKPTT